MATGNSKRIVEVLTGIIEDAKKDELSAVVVVIVGKGEERFRSLYVGERVGMISLAGAMGASLSRIYSEINKSTGNG